MRIRREGSGVPYRAAQTGSSGRRREPFTGRMRQKQRPSRIHTAIAKRLPTRSSRVRQPC